MNKAKAKTIYIKTFGCVANVRDTEALLGLFLARGYKRAEDAEKADVVLANTCSVRALAESKALSFLGEFQGENPGLRGDPNYKSHITDYKLPEKLHSGKRKRICNMQSVIGNSNQARKKVIGLIGCMAVNQGRKVFQKMAYLDLICAPGALERIPDYVEEIMRYKELQITDYKLQIGKQKNSAEICNMKSVICNGDKPRKRIIDLEDRMRDEAAYEAPYREKKNHANVVISTGCANACSYCIVPFVRGKLRLRKPEDILNEVKLAVKGGAKKITLLGQNVNDYNYRLQITDYKLPEGKSGSEICNLESVICNHAAYSFVELLKDVAAVDGVEEIDFISSNPKNTSRELFKLMAATKNIKKYINLPFQSGSNKILKAMNRGYTREQYLAVVKDYKKIVGGEIIVDIIVGFPGETEEDFQETVDLLKQVKPNAAFIFKYSPRPHSKAYELEDDVPKEVKERRNNILLDLQKSL